MYVLYENDNLLERFRLHVQNGTIGTTEKVVENGDADDQEGGTVELNTLQMSRRLHCGPSNGFVLLVAKWSKQTLETIADTVRLIMSQSQGGKLFVVKNYFDPSDQVRLAEHVNSVKEQWEADLGRRNDKTQKLGDSPARSEALSWLAQWTSPGPVTALIVDVDDPTLQETFNDFFSLDGRVKITEAGLERPSLFTKSPALHWTHYPREAEVQATVKLSFPEGCLPEAVFRQLTAAARDSHKWTYEYEWTNGILLIDELVKVTIVRTFAHVMEVSGRIDKDEAADEFDDGGDTPIARVWPLLSKSLKAVMNELDDYPSLPFTPHLVFIGEMFFDNPTGIRPVSARSLDAVQALTALHRIGSVRFRVDEDIFSLRISQAFPGFTPKTLNDLCNVDLPLADKKTPRPSSAPTAIVLEDQSPAPASVSSSSSAAGSNSGISPNLLHIGGGGMNGGSPAHKNRGRRVSFGCIRSIPTGPNFSDFTTTVIQDNVAEDDEKSSGVRRHSLSPPPRLRRRSSSDEEDGEGAKDAKQKSGDSVAEYVDSMLKKTMDELMTTDSD